MRMVTMRVGVAAVFAWALVACGGDDPTGPKAASIQVNVAQVTIPQLDSVQIIPSVLDAGGTLLSGIPMTFETSDASVVVVSAVGVIRSIGPAGSASVTVKGGGLSKSVAVTVAAVAERLSVAPNPGVLPQKATLQIDAKVIDKSGAPIVREITFLASDTAVIDVSATGLVTSRGPSKNVSVTVASGDFAVLVPLAVTQVPTALVVKPAVATVAQGRTLLLSPGVLDAVGAPVPAVAFNFTALTPALITVSADGLVTSVGPLGPARVRVAAVGTALTTDVAMTVSAVASPRGDSLQLINAPGRYAVAFVNSSSLIAGSYGDLALAVDLDDGSTSYMPGAASFGVAVARSRNKAYFTGGGGLQEVDLATQAMRVLPVDGQLFDIVISRDERTAYLGGNGTGVFEVDLEAFTVTRQLMAPSTALHLTLSPSQEKLYSSYGPVTEFDLVTGVVSVLGWSTTGLQATAISSDGRTLYGVSEGGPIVALDLVNRVERTASIPGCNGWGVAISPDDRLLVVSCPLNGLVVTLDPEDFSVVHVFSGVQEGRRVTFSPDGSVAAVGAANGVAIIR